MLSYVLNKFNRIYWTPSDVFSQCKNESGIKAIESVAHLAIVIRLSLFFS